MPSPTDPAHPPPGSPAAVAPVQAPVPERAWPASVSNLPALIAAYECLRGRPVISLRQALQSLGLVDAPTLDLLEAENPELLRSRSPELVLRLLVNAEELHHAHARVAGLPEVDAARFEVERDAFDRLPLVVARSHEVVPLGVAQEHFFVASWCPTSDELHRQLCSLISRSVTLVWAERRAIGVRLDAQERVMAGHLGDERPMAPPEGFTRPVPRVERGVSVDALPVESLVSEALVEATSGTEAEQAAVINEASGMVRLVRKIIQHAWRIGASDIHIETNPGEQITRVRLRRDGDLEPYLGLPARLRAALVSRIKVMAKLDIAERRRPQDGKINFADFGGEPLELRVAVMPTHDGLEDVVLRLLTSTRPIPLSRLGLQPRDETTVARLSAHTFGLILAAGPTGSGKTTTLHSMLAEINTDERKIWTAEDPIEITQAGLRQVQVNPKIGLTFAAAMRSFLRADPDVIMIGEIRDDETAKIAIEASLTGHLVLSTLHTNNASESVVRLLDLGMDPMNFADSLLGIVAQRLVCSLCVHCAQPHRFAPGQFERLVAEYTEYSTLSPDEGRRRLLAAAGVAHEDEVIIRTAHGCEHCGGKGYKGRTGIYEILENNPVLRQLIQQRARPKAIFDAAIESGMRSLRHDALEKLVQGRIDLLQASIAYR